MAGYKGIGVVFLRKAVKAAGGDIEARVRDALTDEERNQFDVTTASTWVPIELITKLFVVASPLLFPADANPVRRAGRALAKDNFKGVYKVRVRVATVQFVADQTAKLWRTYHAAGDASVVTVASRIVRVQVRNYPDLPERFREATAGFMAESIERTGAKNVAVVKGEEPECWTWTLSWR
jgi:hypothetical protein